jgi:hypothetical protein
VKRFYNAKKYEIVEMCACLEVFHFDDIIWSYWYELKSQN